MDLGDSVTTTAKHSEYWYDDGSVIIRVEGTLYKIHLGLLKSLSDTFFDIFTIPAAADSTEGKTEEDPVILQSITRAEFDDFLHWVYKT
ncbi:hypothetical protein H0H92_013504 [Tricholoma furcatifolium]|nr:hypothetical protein H0H92_013504 [Tricholoma furcatifolium]